MPAPVMPSESRPSARLLSLGRGLLASVVLFPLLLACNVVQILAAPLVLLSRRLVRRINQDLAIFFWALCDLWGREWHRVDVTFSGDDLPPGENAILLPNHQSMADVALVLALARRHHRLRDLKWFAKDVLKWIPGPGWGMFFIDCIFVKRDWAADRGTIGKAFETILRDRLPVWVISFPEGTRLRPHKLEANRAWAVSQKLEPTEFVMLPRTKGFVATLGGLAGHLHAVVDVSIGFPQGVPSLWQWVSGQVKKVQVDVRRFPISELPQEAAEQAEWLITRYQEKDRWLAALHRGDEVRSTGEEAAGGENG